MRDREFSVRGERHDLQRFGIDLAPVRRLMAYAEPSELYWADQQADPGEAFEILVGDETATLWVGAKKVSEAPL